MKPIFIILSCMAIYATCHEDCDEDHEEHHPGTTDDAKTYSEIIGGGNTAGTCAMYALGDESIVYKDLECQFPPEDENTTMFKYCLFSFIAEPFEDCIDKPLIQYLVTDRQYEINEMCGELNGNRDKCCGATKEDQPKACLDVTNCYIHCALGCTDLCPLENLPAEGGDRSHAKSSKSHKKQTKSKQKHHGKSKNHHVRSKSHQGKSKKQ